MSNEDGSRVVGPELDGALIDAVVRALYELSWGRARELVKRGKIKVDGQLVISITKKVYGGSTIRLDLAAREPRRDELAREALVHVDAHIVVVDKPSGISTVPYDPEGMGSSLAVRARPGEEVTLDQRVRAALARREKARGRSGPPPDVGVVHRLDKETSGLIVFTRSWAAKRALTRTFRAHTAERRYLAIVHGVPRDGEIVSHFIENRGDGLRGSIEKRGGRNYAVGSERTQRAVTYIEVIEKLAGTAAGQPCALVAVTLETGRTHQIRIHLAEAGHPVLGERVYTRGFTQPLVPAPRVMLHAERLGLVHPVTEEAMAWTAPVPADMAEMLAFLKR